MKHYGLKDKDKQAKYLAVFPDFLTALTSAMNHRDPDAQWVSVQSGEYEYSVNVYPEEVETFAEYDPDAWNDYPDVMPPKDVYMQCEGHFSAGGKFKSGAFYDGKYWCTPLLGTLSRYNIKIDRFRPWDREAAK